MDFLSNWTYLHKCLYIFFTERAAKNYEYLCKILLLMKQCEEINIQSGRMKIILPRKCSNQFLPQNSFLFLTYKYVEEKP